MIGSRSLRYLLLVLVLALCLLAPRSSAQQTGAALPTYELPVQAKAADLSPDESVVAVVIWRRLAEGDPLKERLVEIVQLWDFKSQRLIAERTVNETILLKSLPDPAWPRHVRFSGDGQRLVVYCGTSDVLILRLPGLEEANRIHLQLPPQTALGNFQFDAYPCELQPTPSGSLVAVSLCQPLERGALQMYDWESGDLLWQWPTGAGGMAWRPDGQRLALARAGRSPYVHLFVFEPQSGALLRVIHPGHSAGSVALTPDNRLYTVDINPMGVIENRKPKIHIFDADTGKRLGTIAHGGSGVRYDVSTSQDGRRLLAYTGLETLKWSYEGLAFFPERVDSRFTIWDLRTMRELFTSSNMGLPAPSFGLSHSGKYVLSTRHLGRVAILQLPD